jgi:hypothetical protein
MEPYGGVLSEGFLEKRNNAKNTFKQGKVEESFDLLLKLLDDSRKRVAEKEENAWYELLESLIVSSRLRLEVGEFPRVDWYLAETKYILNT